MALIPESTIEEILSRIDIIELISSCIPLKRIGKSYKALCPFHSEKTPSFVVSQDRQIFHCFGCSAGGNAIGFLMQYERLQFPEAVEALAKKAGVILPQASSSAQETRNRAVTPQLYAVNELAAQFYSKYLCSPEGKTALAYLKKRGIGSELITSFKIGYAPSRWDGLLTYARDKNYSLGLIEKAGLVIPKDGGGYYDRFRGRLMIPIVDAKDRVVAFGARVLDQSFPKYINSPETAVYTKGKILFGLITAAQEIRAQDTVIIVEGYFDLMMPYQAGIKNIVASCGTALTLEQIRLLKRYTHNVIMIYDSDNAGQMATMRSLHTLVHEGMDVKVVCLPQGYDPDAYMRHFGPEKFRALVAQAKDIFDYAIDMLKIKYNPCEVSGKVKIASEMLVLIGSFDNTVIVSAYIKKLAQELTLDEHSLLVEFKKIKHAALSPMHEKKTPVSVKPFLASLASERLLVKLMLEEQELIENLKGKITPADFRDSHLSRIVERMFDLFCQGKKIDAKSLVNDFSDSSLSAVICELAAGDGPQSPDRGKAMNDCIKRMKEDTRKLKQQEICEKMKLAEVQKDEHRLKELLEEFQCLSKKGG
ncbi:MAG: DNA primase [Omnitrophica WOR_2 bacterium GWF2_43_52]|nr:MAG: DNA primase [Omnitrophica WOR_2 bacterium GWC2_44_8]OGX20141.1 MAG: DNA primase [Omnitrophica WOR_2 bacterium GWF2_43_52]HAH20968.1 DNA primase [Candidatus Omnitrophota bacterium]HBG63712.1 DNA primase [Candidatus Omnitrophota bacterium]HCD37181.1 DNA primase [Candidatus Omnitrophota bacterium]